MLDKFLSEKSKAGFQGKTEMNFEACSKEEIEKAVQGTVE